MLGLRYRALTMGLNKKGNTMKYVLIAAFTFFAFGANAADITISATNDAGTLTRTVTMTEANMDRFLAWALVANPGRFVVAVVDGEEVEEWAPHTQNQAVRAVFLDILQTLKGKVRRAERDVARQALTAPADLD